MAARVGQTIEVLGDELDEDGAIAVPPGQPPDIDGDGVQTATRKARPRAMSASVDETDEYDCWGRWLARIITAMR